MSAQYKVKRGALRLPGKSANVFIHQGEVIPAGELSEKDVAALLKDGRIEPVSGSSEQSDAERKSASRGPWRVDPASLVGKDLESLLVMVQEIDPNMDISALTTEQSVVALLTRDWDPALANQIARSSDRSAPRLTQNGVKNVNPNEDELAALARARERAQAPA